MPSEIRQPDSQFVITPAAASVSNAPHKILVVGQKTASGTATAGALVTNILDDSSWDTLFGAKSMIAGMIRAMRSLNKETRIDAISLDDSGTGVAATGTVAVTGTATGSGTLEVTVGSGTNHSYSIAVTTADTATVVGAAIAAAITADTNAPFTAANVTGTVTITAANDGTVANSIGISVTGTVAGIATTVTGMASGANDPTLTGVFDPVLTERYQTIVWPYVDTSEVVTLLDARFNSSDGVMDGVAITARHDTLANHLSALASLNSPSLVVFTDKKETATNYAGPALLEWEPNKAAQFAAVRALRLTDDASIARFVTTAYGSRDAFGGPALASKPYFNTPMPDLPLVGIEYGWTSAEIEQLVTAGGAIIGINTARTAATVGEVPTTYKTDSSGNPDLTFKFLNYVDTSTAAREYFSNNADARFAQSRLTAGDVLRNRDMANDLTIIAFFEKLYQDLSGADYVLLEAGETALQSFKDNLLVVLDLATGKATVTMEVNIVVQLRVIRTTMRIAFSTQS